MTAFNRAVEGLSKVSLGTAIVRLAVIGACLAPLLLAGQFATGSEGAWFAGGFLDGAITLYLALVWLPSPDKRRRVRIAGTINTETGEITDRESPTGGRFRFSVAPDVTFSTRADYTAVGDYGSSPLDETDPTGEEG